MKNVIVYHKDLDGIVSGLLMRDHLGSISGEEPVMLCMNYGPRQNEDVEKINAVLNEDDVLWMVDYIVAGLDESGKKCKATFKTKYVKIIDHHAVNFAFAPDAADMCNSCEEAGKSGAWLVFEFLSGFGIKFDQKVIDFIQMVSVYDTFDKRDPELWERASVIQNALRARWGLADIMNPKKFSKDFFKEVPEIDVLYGEGLAIQRYIASRNAGIVSQSAIECILRDETGDINIVIGNDRMNNPNILFENSKYASYDFFGIVTRGILDDAWQLSVTCKDPTRCNWDGGVYGKRHGAGGHPGIAGGMRVNPIISHDENGKLILDISYQANGKTQN